ncbi:MBL fold metallo-hydrolase [Paenibacillus selenitireducens]|uniref:MBL fold metallo-hydrolase n=1 Tax=Paenibacillus selenitireducens TaxID=1324314 RepID=A0A1T2XD97_9BACL|nr:MBL fold metallo-hydrolase [Paenibacillus selenitireducens]OPA77859.1 MBL fold metallo-hydrolase [Paenibacillus selenitireducens]
MDELIFLGTGDSMGVPRVYCDCMICEEARTTGMNRRYRSAVMIRTAEGDILIDCGPDWVTQMEQIEQRFVSHTLITHAHFDHIAGLPEWVDACRWLGQRGHIYSPSEVLETIRAQFPWLPRHLYFHEIKPEGMELYGWKIEPHLMCHGKNGMSYAFRLTKGDMCVGYCSDAINLSPDQKLFLMNLDLLILGTNFYHEEAEFHTRSVYDMVEAIELLQELQPSQVYFTHMGHGVDVEERYAIPSNVTLARTGMRIALTVEDA